MAPSTSFESTMIVAEKAPDVVEKAGMLARVLCNLGLLVGGGEGRDVDKVQREAGRVKLLNGLAVGECEGGTQDVVASFEEGKGLGEGLGIERTKQAESGGDVV